ncbi:MAG: hypothetical protein OXH38_10745 [Chloroflexi bacterium]|nr:hypothetical protein [Chloroflexota bacterium]
MPNHKAVEEVLNAFLGLFTRPFEQDLRASSKAATTAIVLAALPGFGLLFNGRTRPMEELVFPSLVLVLVWMLLTAVFTKKDKGLTVARNLSVLSFWIAATLVVIFCVDIFRPDPFDGAVRFMLAAGVLFVLVPVHMLRNLPVWLALKMTLPLWISTMFLARIAL